MRKDSDIEIFKKIIKNQSPIGIRSNDWDKLVVEQQKYPNGDVDLKIPVVQVIFCFTKFGRLKGIANYKQ